MKQLKAPKRTNFGIFSPSSFIFSFLNFHYAMNKQHFWGNERLSSIVRRYMTIASQYNKKIDTKLNDFCFFVSALFSITTIDWIKVDFNVFVVAAADDNDCMKTKQLERKKKTTKKTIRTYICGVHICACVISLWKVPCMQITAILYLICEKKIHLQITIEWSKLTSFDCASACLISFFIFRWMA